MDITLQREEPQLEYAHNAPRQTPSDLNPPRKFSKKERSLARACEKLLGCGVLDITYPGGRSRDAVVIELDDGRDLIAAKRNNRFRAQLEHRVVGQLAAGGAPVPMILAHDGQSLVIQERLVGERLSAALHGSSEKEAVRLLDSAMSGLAGCHRVGSEAGLEADVPALGQGKAWLNDLLRRPLAIGGYLLERPARPRIESLRKLLEVRTPRFVKWDARPGNAMVDAQGRVSWFDWEHCGARNRIDDVAWLLCDEFTPDIGASEEDLIARHVEAFADDLSVDQAYSYLYAYGVFHSVVRLGLILSRKKDKPWWDINYCVERDKVGVTLESALRITRRAARWASAEVTTKRLEPWFLAIGEKLHAL